jgi:hypothetical protein
MDSSAERAAVRANTSSPTLAQATASRSMAPRGISQALATARHPPRGDPWMPMAKGTASARSRPYTSGNSSAMRRPTTPSSISARSGVAPSARRPNTCTAAPRPGSPAGRSRSGSHICW